MTNVKEHSDFFKTFFVAIVVCALFIAAALSVMFFSPRSEVAEVIDMVLIEEPQAEENIFVEEDVAYAENVSWVEKDSFDTIRIEDWSAKDSTVDKGLELYRNPSTRAAVEWLPSGFTFGILISHAPCDKLNLFICACSFPALPRRKELFIFLRATPSRRCAQATRQRTEGPPG